MRNNKFGLLLIATLLSSGAALQAAENTPDYQPFTLGLEAGTTGAGAFGRWRFADHLGARAGFDYFEFSRDDTIKDVNYNARLRLMSEPLTLDIFPFKSSSFYISAGVMFNQNRLAGSALESGNPTFNLNGNTYSAAQVGTLNLKIEEQPVNPYLSLGGNIYFDHAHHFSLGGELGVAYTGNPKVNLTRNGPANTAVDNDVAAESNKIKSYARDAQFWPVLKISFNYSF